MFRWPNSVNHFIHIWLCRQDGDHFWSESRLNISLLMLDIEHLARGKGLR
ncbi:hypothetical protein ACP8YA_25045 [Escherichia coli]